MPPTQTPANTANMHPSGENKKDKAKGVLATIGVFLLAPLLAIFLTAFVFQSYEVDGPSMETTLQNQDRLIVYKLPKTWSRIWNSDYVPPRGEIIIFTEHAGTAFTRDGDKQLIKRVIGVPGDRVVVKKGVVTVYNQENPNGFQPDKGEEYSKSFTSTSGNVDVKVDDGEIFVMGDNRSNSLDSRVFGPVKIEDITGELVLRIYPFNKFDAF